MRKGMIAVTIAASALLAVATFKLFGHGRGQAWPKEVECRLAYTAKGYYAPQFLASRKGWLAAEGVRVRDVQLGMSAGVAAAEALVSGSADVAVMGDVPALIALSSARKCVLVAAYLDGERMHSIVVPGGSSLRAPEDLKGKRLGVQFGSSTHGAVQLYLERHGIAAGEVALVDTPQKDLIEALASGSVDALAASEPTPMMALRKLKGASELANLSGLGNDYPAVIVASQEFADAHPEAVRAIVAGTRKAVEWINRDPDGAARAAAEVTGAPADLEAAMFRKMRWEVGLSDRTLQSLSSTAEFLHRIGKLKAVPDVRAMSRPELLKP